jgi:hypothetical protein
MSSSSYGVSASDGMDWDPEPEVRVAAVGTNKQRAKHVSQDVLRVRRRKRLCLRCGHPGHRIDECSFLPPLELRQRTVDLRADDDSS